MGLGQCISNTELLDLWQLCEIDEKQYNMRPLNEGGTNKQKRKSQLNETRKEKTVEGDDVIIGIM